MILSELALVDDQMLQLESQEEEKTVMGAII